MCSIFEIATTLCNNVVCKNSGVCNILSATESSCWCLLGKRESVKQVFDVENISFSIGFHGEYCERQQG